MALSQSQLEIAITAQDEASDAIKKVGEALKGLGAESVQATQKTSDGFTDMAKAVALGQAAFALLKESADQAIDFIKESFTAATSFDAQMARLATTIKGTGESFAKASPQINEFITKMAKLGVSDNDVAISLNKLIKAGADVSTALKLTKSASDLAASGFHDINTNVDNLSAILSGHGTRAARAYSVTLKDNATTGEILNKVLGQITTSTEQYAQTSEGQIKILKQSYHDLQQAIGEGLVNATHGLAMGLVQDAGTMQDHLGDVADTVAIFGIRFGAAVGLILDDLKAVIQTLYGMFKVEFDTFSALVKLAQASGDALKGNFDDAKNKLDQSKTLFQGVGQEVSNTLGLLGKYADDAGKKFEDFMHPEDTLADIKAQRQAIAEADAVQQVSLDNIRNKEQAAGDAAKELVSKLKDSKKAYTDFSNEVAITLQEMKDAHEKSFDASTQKMQELADEYEKTKQEGAQALSELKSQNIADLAQIDRGIASTQKAIASLNAEFEKTKAGNVSELAQAFIATEQKIKDIKKQIVGSTDTGEIRDLKDQQRQLEASLNANKDIAVQYANEIAEARRRAGESDLDRAIEDFNTKQTLAQQEHDARLAELQDELNQEQQKRDAAILTYNAKVAATQAELTVKLAAITKEQFAVGLAMGQEQTLYAEATAAINNILAIANSVRQQMTRQTTQVTVDSLNVEIQKYNELKSAIQAAQNAKTSAALGVVGSFVGVRDAIISPSGKIITTDPADYLIATKNPGSLVGAGNGGGNVVVNINGGNYLSEDAAEQMGNMIIDKLKNQIRF